ncbi:MAG: hypothetical protein ACKO22_06040, partial [Cyanobium sp.]
EGLFGYFPSYAVGHLVSAQLAEAMERDLGPIEERLRRGEDQTVFDWLAERVWPLGRSVEAGELVELVSGVSSRRRRSSPIWRGSWSGSQADRRSDGSPVTLRKMPPRNPIPWRTSTTHRAARCSISCTCCRPSPTRRSCG